MINHPMYWPMKLEKTIFCLIFKKIFQRFYRGDASRQRQSGSYGLGLPIAQSLAAVHKARIVVEGETGKYVRFRVIF